MAVPALFTVYHLCRKWITRIIKDVFKNEVTLQYFPPTRYIWYFYCASVAIVFGIVKLVNYGLHHMYDTTECIKEEVEEEWQEQKK